MKNGSPWIAFGVMGGDMQPQGHVQIILNLVDYDLDLHIPTKAVMGQAYLIAKINLLKALGYTLDSAGARASLCVRVEREVGQSIYTKLAEELFISIVTDRSAPASSALTLEESRSERK